MSDVTKHVDRGIPVTQRTLVFNQDDGGTGDVFLVEASMGKKASHMVLEATDAVTIKLNVYHHVFPLRKTGEGLVDGISMNLTKGGRVKRGTASISIDAGGTLTLDADTPISDIEIVSASGDFEIFLV